MYMRVICNLVALLACLPDVHAQLDCEQDIRRVQSLGRGACNASYAYTFEGPEDAVYAWDFGEGAVPRTADGREAYVYYPGPEGQEFTRTASLTVTYRGQTCRKSLTGELLTGVVHNPRPILFPTDPSCDALAYTFDARTYLAVTWDFGEGATPRTSTEPRGTVRYDAPGPRAVTITPPPGTPSCVTTRTIDLNVFSGNGFDVVVGESVPVQCSRANTGRLVLKGVPEALFVFEFEGDTQLAPTATYNDLVAGPMTVRVYPRGRPQCARDFTFDVEGPGDCTRECDQGFDLSPFFDGNEDCISTYEYRAAPAPEGSTYRWDFGETADERFKTGRQGFVSFYGERREVAYSFTITGPDGATCRKGRTEFVGDAGAPPRPEITVVPLPDGCETRRFRVSASTSFDEIQWDFDGAGLGDVTPATAVDDVAEVTYDGAPGLREIRLTAASAGCPYQATPTVAFVEVSSAPTIDLGTPDITAPTCDDPDAGAVTLEVSPPGDYVYVLDGVEQSGPTFTGLSAGTKPFEVYAVGAPTCARTGSVELPAPVGCGGACPDFEVEVKAELPATCDNPNSGLLAVATESAGAYVYAIGDRVGPGGVFVDLAAGDYTVTAYPLDRPECARDFGFTVPGVTNCDDECEFGARVTDFGSTGCGARYEFDSFGPDDATYSWDFGEEGAPRFQSGSPVRVTFQGERRFRPEIRLTVTAADGTSCTQSFVGGPIGPSDAEGEAVRIDVEPLPGACGTRRFRFSTNSAAAELAWDLDTGGAGDADPATATGSEVIVTYSGGSGPRGVSLVADDPACNPPPPPVTASVEVVSGADFDLGEPVVTRPTCANPDVGTVTIPVSPFGDYVYVLDGTEQASRTFSGLSAGTRTFEVYPAGAPECAKSVEATVPEAVDCGPACPEFEVAVTVSEVLAADPNSGTVIAVATPAGAYIYELDGETNETGTFTDLATGARTLRVYPVGRPDCEQVFPVVSMLEEDCLPEGSTFSVRILDGCPNRFKFVAEPIPGAVFSWDLGPTATPRIITGDSGVVAFTRDTESPISIVFTTAVGDCIVAGPRTQFLPIVSDPPPGSAGIEAAEGAPGCGTRVYAFRSAIEAETYAWDFGEGATPRTSTEREREVTYAGEDGPRTVTLLVNGDLCPLAGSEEVDVTLGTDCSDPCPPVLPELVLEPVGGGCAGGRYRYRTPTDADGYVWTFGPGATPASSTDRSGEVDFGAGGGSRSVFLEVARGDCRRGNARSVDVLPEEAAAFTVERTGGGCGFVDVRFTASEIADAAYDWSFPTGAVLRDEGPVQEVRFTGTTRTQLLTLTVNLAGCSVTRSTDVDLELESEFAVEVRLTALGGTCETATFEYEASGGGESFRWTFGAPAEVSDPGARTGTVTFAGAAGERLVRVEATAGGCTADDERTIPFSPPGGFTVRRTGVTSASCGGGDGAVTVVAEPAGDYRYTLGAQTNTDGRFGGLAAGPAEITVTAVGNEDCSETLSVTVPGESTLPADAADFTQELLATACGRVDYRLTAASDIPGATYTWAFADGSVPEVAEGREVGVSFFGASGLRTVALTVALGTCTRQRSPELVVAIPQSPDVEIVAETQGASCGSETFAFSTPAAAEAYAWDFGPGAEPRTSTEPTATVTFSGAPGTREITLVATEGPCSTPASTTIDYAPSSGLPPATASFVGDLLSQGCGQATYRFTAAEVPGATYRWTFGPGATPERATDRSVAVVYGGSPRREAVRLTVELGACTQPAERLVDLEIGPAPDFGVAVVEQRGVGCADPNSGGVTVRADAAGEYRYTLGAESNTTGAFTGLRAGPYSVTVVRIGDERCLARYDGVIAGPSVLTEPVIALATARGECGDPTYVIGLEGAPGAGVGYRWSFGAGAQPAAAEGPGPHAVRYPGVEGTRSVRVEASSETGCRASALETLDVSVVAAFAVTAEATPPACGEDATGAITVAVSGLGDFRYRLDDGPEEASPLFEGLAPGTYVVSVRRAGAAAACAEVASVTIETPPPLSLGGVSVTAASCGTVSDGEIILPDLPPGTRAELTGADRPASASFGGLAGGAYPLRLTDAAGCVLDTVLVVPTLAGPQLDLGPDRRAVVGETVTLSPAFTPGAGGGAPATVRAFGGDSTVVREASALAVTLVPTRLPEETFTVTLTDEAGCSVTDVVTVFTRVDRRGYEVPTAFSPNDDGVNDRWVLRATPSVRRVRSARVFDRWGGQLYFRTDVPLDDEEAGWDGRVGGEALDVGVYVYAVEVEFVDGSTRVLAGELNLLR